MNVQKNKAPDFPTDNFIRNLERVLENLSYFKRRVFLNKRVVSNYPRFFYRYLSLDPTDDNSIKKLRDVIVNSSLWLSSREGFNDPFDLKAKYIIEGGTLKFRNKINKLLKIHNPELGGVKRTKEINRIMASQPNLLKNLNNTMTNSLESIGVCCFTVDPRNLLMWSHYASHHRGIVLQFELARDTSAFLKNVRVVYVNDYPLLNWANETESEISKSFLNKFKTWEYEKEWRMVHIFGANSYINFKPEALTGVIFGCKADGNIKNAVNEMLAERTQKNMPPVNTYNTSMHDSKYRLVIKK